MKIHTFDTTLRDGTQGEAVSFSVDDKLLIASKLDDFGIDYIEGGWPGSNPKDHEFFARAQDMTLHARQADRFRRHALRPQPGRRGRQRAGAGRRRHAGGVDLRQDLGLPRAARARHHTRRESGAHRGHRRVSEGPRPGGGLRRRAFLRRLHRAIRTTRSARSKPPRRPAPMCCASATPTAARRPARLREIVADVRRALRRRHRHSSPQRFGRGRRQRAGGSGSREPRTSRAA